MEVGKVKQMETNILYIKMNRTEHHVLSHGITFSDLFNSVPNPIQSVLLLQHKFEDVSLHLRSYFHYIEEDKIKDLAEEDVSRYGEFSWVDFDNLEALDELEDQEIAELLFMHHMKHPLKSPFFQRMNNRFVYLAQDDGWFNKTYYRNLDDFYDVLALLIMKMVEKENKHKRMLFFKKTVNVEPIDKNTLQELSVLLCEGCAIDTEKVNASRAKFEIPIYSVGDYWNMDEMREAYENAKKKPDVVLIYNKKEKKWAIQ